MSRIVRGMVAKDLFIVLANHAGLHPIFAQEPSARFPLASPVPHAARKLVELHGRIGFELGSRAIVYDADPVLEPAQEAISLAQDPVSRGIDDPCAEQRIEGLPRVSAPNRWMTGPLHQLKELYHKLHVDEATAPKLEIEASR